MKTRMSGPRIILQAGASVLLVLALSPTAAASTAYGSLNNFDCVNDTGVEAHGFEIELDDVHSTDITYTYDYNHYGIPKITQDDTDPAHPKVFVRYAAAKNPDGSWSAFTAVPSGPISPTDGHQFTNPSVNFGGEHFGVGYYGAPTAVKYNWLIDDGSGNLVHGPSVYVATPTFTYYPPGPALPLPVVQAVVVPPPPPAPPVLQFGEASWVKDIKTTTPNANKVELGHLIDPDPNDPLAPNWTNGEPAEVETEWRILQTEFANLANPKGELAGLPQELPGGDEVVTRRYEFYKYAGPIDAESGEAMADAVAADGIHGVGSVTYNDHIDPVTGEWVTVTVDLSTIEVVGEFFGAQMAAFDLAPALGLVDHIPDGEIGVPYADRAVVIAGGAKVTAAVSSGSLPPGTDLDSVKGVFSGTPTTSGAFTFTVEASLDGTDPVVSVSKSYTVTIPAAAPVMRTVSTSASPPEGGSTTGDGEFADGTPVTVVATHNPGYAFVIWTEGDAQVSNSAVYPFTVSANRTLVANFLPTYTISTSSAPAAGGTTSGGDIYVSGESVTVQAAPNATYRFVDWTEGGAQVSTSAAYNFTAAADRSLVANFEQITYNIGTSSSPALGGGTTGGGVYVTGDSVTVHATANAGYAFVDWTEGGTEVSTTADYNFTALADRSLVANFGALPADLSFASVSASRSGSKVTVSFAVQNTGGTTAQAVSLDARKAVTLDGKSAAERMPVLLGDIVPAGSAGTSVSFHGIKPGTLTLQVTLTYDGGSATLGTGVIVP